MPRRSWVPVALAVLLVGSGVFFAGQNTGGGLGGRMSPAKLLWLDYALAAWFLLPFGFATATGLDRRLRWVYGWHLASFGLRGAVELWLLYGPRAWIPPYGIAHDLFHLALLGVLMGRLLPRSWAPPTTADRVARRFLASIRLGLCAEILFAFLFYQVAQGQTARVWFADDSGPYRFIIGLTWLVVVPAWVDLGYTLVAGSCGAGSERRKGEGPPHAGERGEDPG